jgi:hypothetical protein
VVSKILCKFCIIKINGGNISFMKKRILLLYIILSINILAGDKLNINTNEAIIDFENEEFQAGGGVNFNYDDIKLKAYKLRKLKDKNIIIAEDGVIFNKGDNKVESYKLTLNIDKNIAIIQDGISYVEVSGAPKRHNRLYYGGEQFVASYPDKAEVKNAWFTTSHKALEVKEQDDRFKLPYHMSSKKILVYPGKKVVAYNNILYAGRIPIFWMPWYASSLKSETQAPLFPKIGSNSDDGTYIIWGFDYGIENENLNGSLALKQSTKKGTFIESFENVYKVNDENKGKVSFYDTLVFPRGDYEEQWDFEHEHTYKTKNGELNWKYKNQTINTINAVEDARSNAEDSGESDPYSNYEQKMSRYELSTNFDKIGKNKDTSIYAYIQYVDNTDVLKEIINSNNENILNKDDKSEVDNEIQTKLKFDKDNLRYKLYGYYERFEDLDTGSSKSDTKSYNNVDEYKVVDKKYKLDFYYKNTNYDVWRTLSDSERYNDDEELKKYTNTSYNPYTTAQYDEKSSKDFNATIGNYNIYDKFNLKFSYNYDKNYEKLNLDEDPFRSSYTNARDRQYNRTIDIIEKNIEQNGYQTELSKNSKRLKLVLGDYKSTIKDRDLYEDTGYDEFINNSNYNIIEYQDSKINTKLGNLDFLINRRYDKYFEKDTLQEFSTKEILTKNIYDNTGDFYRDYDLKIDNKFSYYMNYFVYNSGNRDFNDSVTYISDAKDSEYYRLNGKNLKKDISNELKIAFGNTDTIYNINLITYNDAYKNDWLKSLSLKNSIDFSIDNKKTIYTSYDINNSYQEDNYKNIDNQKYKLELYDDNREFKYNISYYKNKVRDESIDTSLDYSDRIRTYNFLKYIDKDITNSFEYSFGEKNNKWWTLNYSITTNTTYDYNDSTGSAVNSYSENILKNQFKINYLVGDKSIEYNNYSYELIDYNNKVDNNYSYYQNEISYEYNDLKKEEDEKVVYTDSTGEYQVELTKSEEEELQRKFLEQVKKERGITTDIFGIDNIADDTIYKKYNKFTLTLKSDKNYTKETNFINALELFKIRLEIHRDENKLIYSYDEENSIYNSVKSLSTSKIHYLEFTKKIGEIDKKWIYKFATKYKTELKDSSSEENLDEIRATLGKEIEFGQWQTSYELDWNQTYLRYDYTISFSFNLFTFPDKSIGLGKDSNENGLKLEAGI